ncbi:MAG: TIGR02147 family protein [Bacteriovoracaceae bacterium]|nr:TIGR02147 family protein [Bacteriovoracaceae bacterium]
MNIFNELDYRDVLRKTIEERKKIDSSITYQSMASHMRIQKAYLSQVIKGVRDLNQDQLYLAAQFLNFTSEESEYLKLLLDYARCALKDREKNLLKEIKVWQKQKNKTSEYIDVEELTEREINREDYYLDPMNQVIHMGLHCEEFRKDPMKLAERTFLPKKRVSDYIQNLERMGIITMSEKGIQLIDVELHLPKDSPIFHSYKSQCYTNTMNRLKQLEDSKTYNFSVVFSGDENVRKEISTQFMKFLSKTKKLVSASKSKEVFQMNFDLFSWTETK